MDVKISARGTARVQGGHPWVYRSDVLKAPERPGIYPVQGTYERVRREGILGWALVNAQSEITVRMLSRSEKRVTERELAERLELACSYRDSLEIDATAYRLVHGEADGLPGLIIDRYDDVLVVQNGSAALEPMLDSFLDVLEQRIRPRGVLARFDARTRAFEGLAQEVRVLRGNVPEELEIQEGAVRYLVEPRTGQKTGAFLDQRENRLALARQAARQGARSAVDVFSYHGSFALHLARVCEEVECIDASAEALARAAQNAERSQVRFTCVVGNAFDLLRERERLGVRFDVVSLDPPALAKTKRDLEAAYRGYKELNLRALKLLNSGGILGTATCSYHMNEALFYEMLREAAADARRNVRVLERRGASADHPELLAVPESRYLKFAILEVL